MAKNKLSKKVLKAFLDSIKKIESIDLKEKYEEAGKVVANYALILKHKEGKKSKLLKLIAAISEDTGVNELLKKVKGNKKDKDADKKSVKKKTDKKSPAKKSSKNQLKKEELPKVKSSKKAEKKDNKNEAKKSKSQTKKPATIKPVSKSVKKKIEPVVSKIENIKTISKSIEPKVEAKQTSAKPEAIVTKKQTTSKPVATKTLVKQTIESPVVPEKPAEKKVVVIAAPKPAVKKAATLRKPAVTSIGENLKLIEGIGPKIESFLKEDGIDTFEKLAKAIPETIQAMLIAKGGTRYNANNPTTWPEQAALAAKGDMAALKALKLELKGGRKV
jgi:predicted flap endonuclease-1-like 5' DNA nuclease